MKRTAGLLMSLFLCVPLLFSLSRGEASNDKWIYIAGTKQDQGFFYDRESILHLSHDVVQVWTRRITRDSSEIKALQEVNCTYKIIRDVQAIAERRTAKTPAQIINREWREVIRGTPEGELFALLCRKPAPESFKRR